jgi:hypothetical protein
LFVPIQRYLLEGCRAALSLPPKMAESVANGRWLGVSVEAIQARNAYPIFLMAAKVGSISIALQPSLRKGLGEARGCYHEAR